MQQELASSGPSLHAWEVAIAREVPEEELSLDDADKELRQLRLAPIICSFELRCFWCNLELRAHDDEKVGISLLEH